MTKEKEPTDFFTKELAERYDERNKNLSPISDNLHFLIRLILKDLPEKAKILSVGAGTGAEIIALAKHFPEWSFVAVEPSLAMLEVCKEKVQEAGIQERFEFFHGYAKDFDDGENFDAALAILVGHFVKKEERVSFYKSLVSRLKAGGYFINAEISYDLNSPEFPKILKGWEQVQRLMGATPDSSAGLPKQLKEVLTVLPPEEVKSLICEADIELPVRFFQALMICGWYGVK
jgi:tRNA (cmo5U34)-methyltransferase